eukprot:TRINITY_DN22770_c0_g1_i1.p1 TRINITY_DN22770_c0_g1~~TRINITY_DN22770_c0_g1_i1.p1  ORF type:complete len:829 (-),score=206.44 TRINITY_DN22770_c0_g1_i1:359-2845(-)
MDDLDSQQASLAARKAAAAGRAARKQRRRLRLACAASFAATEEDSAALTRETSGSADGDGAGRRGPIDIVSQLLEQVAQLEEGVKQACPASSDDDEDEPLSGPAAAEMEAQLQHFMDEAVKVIQDHCAGLMRDRAQARERTLVLEAHKFLQEVVQHRNKLAPIRRAMETMLPLEDPIYKPLEAWPQAEREAMKDIIEERLLQLLSAECQPPLPDEDEEEETKLLEEVDDTKMLLEEIRRLQLEIDMEKQKGDVLIPSMPRTPQLSEPATPPPVAMDTTAADRLRAGNDKLRRLIEEMQEQLGSAEDAVAGLKADCDALRDQLEKLKAEKEAKLKALEDAKKAYADSKTQPKAKAKPKPKPLPARKPSEPEVPEQVELVEEVEDIPRPATPDDRLDKLNAAWAEEKAELLGRISSLQKELGDLEASAAASDAEASEQRRARKKAQQDAASERRRRRAEERASRKVHEEIEEREPDEVFDQLYQEAFDRHDRQEEREREGQVEAQSMWLKRFQALLPDEEAASDDAAKNPKKQAKPEELGIAELAEARRHHTPTLVVKLPPDLPILETPEAALTARAGRNVGQLPRDECVFDADAVAGCFLTTTLAVTESGKAAASTPSHGPARSAWSQEQTGQGKSQAKDSPESDQEAVAEQTGAANLADLRPVVPQTLGFIADVLAVAKRLSKGGLVSGADLYEVQAIIGSSSAVGRRYGTFLDWLASGDGHDCRLLQHIPFEESASRVSLQELQRLLLQFLVKSELGFSPALDWKATAKQRFLSGDRDACFQDGCEQDVKSNMVGFTKASTPALLETGRVHVCTCHIPVRITRTELP